MSTSLSQPPITSHRRLKSDATVLVADFGGGTTDYSLIRFERVAGKLKSPRLSAIRASASPAITSMRGWWSIWWRQRSARARMFKSFDKLLEVPSSYYANFSRWNQLSIFKTTREFTDLKSLVRSAT